MMSGRMTALVTGASGAIGYAIARELAAMGHKVALGYAKNKAAAEAHAEEIAREYGAETLALHIDLTDTGSLDAAAESLREQFGDPQILINNGGAEYIGLFQDMTDAELDRIMAADLTGAMKLTKRLLPAMIRGGRGYIVNISSIWGEEGGSCETAYSAAKAGVIGFTKALAKEVAPSGVLVNCISPGFIDTPMNAALTDEDKRGVIESVPCCRAGTAQDVANAAAFLVSGKADYICGASIKVDGGGFC